LPLAAYPLSLVSPTQPVAYSFRAMMALAGPRAQDVRPALSELEGLELLTERHEPFDSRYFDYQSAYRYALTLNDGLKVECTAYKHFLGGQPTSLAIDISTMVGCPVKCKFCAAGAMRYERTLTPEEMCQQVRLLVQLSDQEHFPKINCSFQGIGEPSLAATEVLAAARVLLSLDQRLTISIATTAASRGKWGQILH